MPSESAMNFGGGSNVKSALSTASFGAVCLNRFRKQTVVMPIRCSTEGGIEAAPLPWSADKRAAERTGATPTAADNCARNTRRFIDILLRASGAYRDPGPGVRDPGIRGSWFSIANDRMMAG